MENEVDALAMVDWVHPQSKLHDAVVEISGPAMRPQLTIRDRRHRHQNVEVALTRDSAIALAHYLLTVTEA
jgi:macrodomain Ter protein organizer (MatP/YcbG family)